MISSLLSSSKNTTLYRPSIDTWASGYGASKCKKNPPASASAGIKTIVDVGDILHQKRSVIENKIDQHLLKYNKGVDQMKYQQTINNPTLMNTSNNSYQLSKITLDENLLKSLNTVDSQHDIHLTRPENRHENQNVTVGELKQGETQTEHDQRKNKIVLTSKPRVSANATKTTIKNTIRHKNVLFSLAKGINTNMDSNKTSCIDLNDNYQSSSTENRIKHSIKANATTRHTSQIDLNDNYQSATTENYTTENVKASATTRQTSSMDINDNYKSSSTQNHTKDHIEASAKTQESRTDSDKTSYSNYEVNNAKQVQNTTVENYHTNKVINNYSYEDNNSRQYTSGKINNLDTSQFCMKADSARVK